ncbi:MAG TPA: deoxyribonuclease IV [Candidatus Methylomirabilis sp.]|nr:deoxyribonuclease IV [Candidatus Methylomirabilis sp.]
MADLLGAHMSIAGGLHRALWRGQEVGCSAVQIFLKNQLQWKAPPYAPSDVREFAAARRATGIRAVFAHAAYLINLAAPAPAEWRRAVAAFHDELDRAETLGLPFVIIHPGSHRGTGLEAGIQRVARALGELLARTRGYRVMVLLENTAGGGDTIGRSFAELGRIMEAARDADRIGVCLDTCHLFAAGYDIRSREGYAAAMAECRRLVGLGRVRAFHLNDAKQPLGSGLDRHEKIGRGHLGRDAFRWLLSDRRFARAPMVLETPKDPEPRADREALALLRELRAEVARGDSGMAPRRAERRRAAGGASRPL